MGDIDRDLWPPLKNFNIAYNFLTVRDGISYLACVFPCEMTLIFQYVP